MTDPAPAPPDVATLVPVIPVDALPVTSPAPQSRTLSRPDLFLQRLSPAKTIHVLDQTIWWFIKVEACGRPHSERALLGDPTVARKCAMITYRRGAATFKLQWYPHDDQPQIVEDLPLDKLSDAVNDLVGAGFGRAP